MSAAYGRPAYGRPVSGAAEVAGVVGSPVRHSLSPLIHNAWLAAAGLDGLYAPFQVAPACFEAFVQGMRGGAVRGLNVTLPFKAQALALADTADDAARQAGAANLLLFHGEGAIEARNTDGVGLLAALAEQAPDLDLSLAPAVVIGAGGAARGGVAALITAGATEIRILNRTLRRAEELAELFPGRATPMALDQAEAAFAGAGLIVNAALAGLNDQDSLDLPLGAAPIDAVVMDMVYKPLRTALLRQAAERGLRTVDGLAMLIGQAIPSFQAFFRTPPPPEVDVRGLALQALGEAP